MWLMVGVGLVAIVLTWLAGVCACRFALWLGEDEGFDEGFAMGRGVERYAGDLHEEARRWQAEAQDDWLAT